MSGLHHFDEPRTTLETQLKRLLDVSRRSKRAPTISLDELAIAIITINPDITLKEVQRHILTAFKYYNAASVECSMTRGYQGSVIINAFNATFEDMLRRFDLPIEITASDPDEPEDEDELYVNPAAAQIFFHKQLTPPLVLARKEQKPFPFLELPVELRLQIYGHVLGLPKSGVAVRQATRYSKKKEVVVRSKYFDVELELSEWNENTTARRPRRDNFEWRQRNDGTFKCQELRKHLAVLSVSKEIYNEAMPVFYSVNSFVCTDLLHLEEFLATLVPERREQLKHISFFYTKNTHSKAAKAFKMLGEIEKLKRLDIVINEEDFVGLTKSNGSRMFPDVLKLPGFHTLRSIRAMKTVRFHGECDTIREALQSWVVDNEVKASRPKPKRKQSKRKAVKKVQKVVPEADEEDEQEPSLFGDASAYEDSEGEEDSTGTEQAKWWNEAMKNDTESFTSHFSAPTSRPSTPPAKAKMDLQSPFKFKPENSGSLLANRFQMQSSVAGKSQATPQKATKSSLSVLSDLASLQQTGFERDGSKQVTPTPSKTSQIPGYQPMPDIATRQRLHGPGQMGNWWQVPQNTGAQTSVWPYNAGMPTSPTGPSLTAPQIEGTSNSGGLSMEDLLDEHENYELLQ